MTTVIRTKVNDTLFGSGLSDFMSGLAGNDLLTGDGGTDTLDGGTGADTLNGGTGDDSYVVDSAADTIIDGAERGHDPDRRYDRYSQSRRRGRGGLMYDRSFFGV
jgi:Ca2+-binding RTX toxin-like protein